MIFTIAVCSESPDFHMWPPMPPGNVPPVFYLLLCASFCDKNGNIPHNHMFLAQMKHKAMDKMLGQHFLKEAKARYQISGKSELKQQKSYLKCTIGWICNRPFNYSLIKNSPLKTSDNQRSGSAFDVNRFSLLFQVGGDVIHPCKICGGCQIRMPRSIQSINAVPYSLNSNLY